MVGSCLQASNVPGNYSQYKQWIEKWLPDGKVVHHFGFAAISWALWKCRNKAVFDNKVIRHPAEILIHACVFLKYWTCLHKEERQVEVLEGVKTLLACAHRVMAQQRRATLNLLPPPCTSTADEEEE